MKKLMIALALVTMQTNLALANQGSETGSVGASATSLAGIQASEIGSVMAFEGSAQASGAMATAASQVIQASVMAGQKIVIAAVEVSGNLVRVTYKASIKGSQLALKLGKDVIVFSATFARAAFEASLRAAGQTLNALVKAVVNGTEVLVRATAIVAGSAGIVVGHVLTLAAQPMITLGVILNEIGEDLYNG